MIKHLYQRTITSNGKKIKAWYYWYYDKEGKQIRKSCGEHGKPCLLKRDAMSFIDKLNDDDLSGNITFNQFCSNFYDDNSKFIIKQKNRNIEYQKITLYQKKLHLQKFLDKFGNMNVTAVDSVDVENWLLELECSNSAKNHILTVINEVENELYIYHFIKNKINVQRFKRNTKPKGILYSSEIKKLFPEDYNELLNVWRIYQTNKEIDIYTFATMIYTILSTGMRSSEIRALHWNQFIKEDVILINAMVDSNRNRVDHLKKGDIENKKWRITILPDKTVRMIRNLKNMKDSKSDYVFTIKDKPIDTWFLLDHFKIVLNKNGIDFKKRNITIHSLRFTYNTLMKREISGDDLRLMMGHTSEQMTEYYDKSKALEHLPELLMNKDNINSVFN